MPMNEDLERRVFLMREMRVAQDGDKPKITGYAAVFNELSEDLGGWYERIAPGAFTETLKNADVRALFNHDPNYVLGRSKSGTLDLEEDATGLAIEIDPPDTQWANDLLVSMKRGDVDQMSFAFRTVKDNWGTAGEQIIRTLEQVELWDVSPVTYPAYPQTSAQVRAMAAKYRENQPGHAQEGQSGSDEIKRAQARRQQLRRRLELEELR